MTLLRYFRDIIRNYKLILQLAKRDVTSRYLGSSLGGIWAFIHPMLLTLTYWVVFQVGFRSFPVGDVPFILWLLAGIVPWFFFSESLSSATSAIEQSSFLVKKVVFKVQLLPIVKIIAALSINVFFIILTIVVYLLYGYSLNFYLLQIVYYMICLTLFTIGLSWITSALNVFFKDVGQIVSIILQFGFWLTPIFWSFSLVPLKYRIIFEVNPLFYIIQGFRDTFVDQVWFWEHYKQTPYFWFLTLFFLVFGSYLFKKLRPHFSDVL
ncbi:ABC transporter permease [Cohnella sp. JJ-181]|uniref:ABC transporter permease n=1 Tax=Cohnella rhizoplanae TaxID=2974897 RepID=UPI0022FF6E36|nr:ABC transporter permease [Cohnella sp. JJ-181]CAI6082024.1 Teichoic acid translocation permease protein TagG [Cohnella sp. JJ-181]